MEKDTAKKVERLLYKYWQKKQKAQMLQAKVERINAHIRDIRGILADKDDLMPTLGIIGNYMTVVTPGSGTSGSKVEKSYEQYEKTLDDLRSELTEKVKVRVRLKMKIMQLETETEGIEFAISMLSEVEQKIVEQRYLYRRSNLQIATALGFDESSIRYRRQAIVRKVAMAIGV